jgi:hypothetical protein
MAELGAPKKMFKQDIVTVNGVKKLRTIVDGSTIVFEDIPQESEETEQPTDPDPAVATPAEDWKFKCEKCDFYTNDQELFEKHTKSKKHKDLNA